jgi:DinB superfamily
MPESISAVSLLRSQLQQAHAWLEGTLADVTPELAHAMPAGTVNPIGAQYAHVLTAEDMFVNNLIAGGAPLMASAFAGQTGISEPMPLNPAWGEWARRVQVDLAQTHTYAQAVYASTDALLASYNDEDLSRTVNAPLFGANPPSAGKLLSNLLLNIYSHAGEISCLKGLASLKGYPS